MARVTRRQFLLTSAAVAAGSWAPAAAVAQTSIKIGTAVLGDYGLAGPVIVGMERGFFKAQGLAVEFVPFRGGPDLSKGVLSGDVLLGISGATDVLVFRERGAPITMIASQALPFIIMGGFFFQMFGLIKIGFWCYMILAVFQLITLPVEFDASRRAKAVLGDLGLVRSGEEAQGVNKVLDAAALTYVAAFVAALGNLLHLWLVMQQRRRE